ncbi:MAG: Organic radical activating enzyme [Candidatus Altiarchaeales archaeon HGW-Altiarchaeales-3]|nr:MAG: Organic radical activating enzyme [Candidatus Altiarchaeales archaeon HGW-Altiarchaeales-3]
MAMQKEHIREIFSSTQGEGIYPGVRQIFIRFPLCNLNCDYCDTPSKELPDFCNVETTPGCGNFKKIKNPISVEGIIEIINDLKTNDLHSISLTGGEPLLYPGFIKELRNQTKISFYLETNSTIPENARKIKTCVDFVAADIKLDNTEFYKNSLETIKILKDRNLFIKIVVLPGVENYVLEKVAQDLKNQRIDVPLVLQPVTPYGEIKEKPDAERLFELADICGKHLTDVRIIPQMHKIWGVL